MSDASAPSLAAECERLRAERDALKAALAGCVEWMEFTIPRLKGKCPHCGKPVDAGGLNWGAPLHHARAVLNQ